MKVYRSMILNAPIEAAWAALRAFDNVSRWNPGVRAARLETGAPSEVGAVRHLDIVDGTVFRETLLAHSDAERFYTYDIIEGPLPVTNYVSTHHLIAVTHTNETLAIWESTFDCNANQQDAMDKIVGDQIYIGGMQGLNDYLTGA